jgi:hypothetical protein
MRLRVELDLTQLRPSQLARVLNSTPLGPVISERHLGRHRTRAGLRLGAGSRINFLRYAAWIADQKHQPRSNEPARDYEARKEAARQRNASIARAGRDIAPLPQVVDPARKATCERDLKRFCEAYCPNTFHLDWSPIHDRIISRIEQSVLQGGLFAVAAPRGTGKSVLAECGGLWAILYGHRRFVCLIGADEDHAGSMLDSIKTEMETNELLLEDFPEIVYPIHRLEGIANRCSGQLCDGERTLITWTAKEIILPTIPDSVASGSIIRVAGLTGRIRGMKHKLADGSTVRPDLVIPDDPQTDESARSLSQCATRERIIAGAVLGLAGPGKKITGVMPCTVIRPGDMADRILDRELHPEWNGERTKMVESFPTNTKLWDEYATLRADTLRAVGTIEAATVFYRKHQTAMDQGAVVSWPARFNPDEASAIQHAMNLKLQDEAAFWSEYQNQPLADDTGTDEQLTVDDIMARVNGYRRGRAPIALQHITGFIDVQGALLYWIICGWADDFTGWVLDYGAEPDQKRNYFTLRDADPTLLAVAGGVGWEGALHAALKRLVERLLARRWQRDDGAALGLERLLIDANWGQSTDIVYNFCQSAPLNSQLYPSHGRYAGASSQPFNAYKRKPGDLIGLNWRVPALVGRRAIRHVLYDTNYWKSFVHTRLATPMGDHGGLSVFGRQPELHRMLAEHCTSEYWVLTEGRGRQVNEWKLRPSISDNHLWDGLVGCAVGASMLGVTLPTLATTGAQPRSKPVKLSALKQQKRQRR